MVLILSPFFSFLSVYRYYFKDTSSLSSWSQDIKAFCSSLACFKSLDELFPPTTTVFMVGNPYYGAMGEVCYPLSVDYSLVTQVTLFINLNQESEYNVRVFTLSHSI